MSADRIKVVYITCPGHSGSTLLDMLLTAHSRAFGVGEIIGIKEYAHVTKQKNDVNAFGSECTCGAASIWDCAFWPRVEQLLAARPQPLSMKDFDFRAYGDPSYGPHNQALFEAVAEASGCRVIIDSSKSPRRLKALYAAQRDGTFDCELLPIQLIRHGRAVIYSNLKQGLPFLRSIGMHVARTRAIRRVTRPHHHRVVWYDRLCDQPERELRAVMAYIGLPFEPAQMRWAGLERHNVGGNKMRRSTNSEIRKDVAWKRGLGKARRLVVESLVWPAYLGIPRR